MSRTAPTAASARRMQETSHDPAPAGPAEARVRFTGVLAFLAAMTFVLYLDPPVHGPGAAGDSAAS